MSWFDFNLCKVLIIILWNNIENIYYSHESYLCRVYDVIFQNSKDRYSHDFERKHVKHLFSYFAMHLLKLFRTFSMFPKRKINIRVEIISRLEHSYYIFWKGKSVQSQKAGFLMLWKQSQGKKEEERRKGRFYCLHM